MPSRRCQDEHLERRCAGVCVVPLALVPEFVVPDPADGTSVFLRGAPLESVMLRYAEPSPDVASSAIGASMVSPVVLLAHFDRFQLLGQVPPPTDFASLVL